MNLLLQCVLVGFALVLIIVTIFFGYAARIYALPLVIISVSILASIALYLEQGTFTPTISRILDVGIVLSLLALVITRFGSTLWASLQRWLHLSNSNS